ncbi:rho family-interacting cell polarization regulator 1-like isoform X2 [Acipenser ruthenus]|nr:rho family-interacting cell polarization regulator 1-like isoform X2 [Acipenser ruthenus]XP_058849848.1 rho family-interacting cell polarization regulator 1-like isoform X2 [Acipenser ruthenus]XP_058849849.1 rho family-interacting cell polarization regulator 1-like isoform X2 [Acipenser ruthenus]
MSLSVRPTRRITSSSINRSQSFAGVNSSDKHYRNRAVFSTPTNSRKSPSRASRMFTLSHKSLPPKVPQPERLDEVYEALKRGLQAYLQVHQLELDSLTRQMRESKRNSRLGFLYDLDKQVKAIERFMRRLEFHLSKIDELYEAYCMHRRLRDGANKMVKAYTAGSPGSREARESLAEANKGYKEYTENMCMLESELENQLGEFQVKMKGLAGFARLCAGDQYEIFMKFGRQRWKLRGRIEINGKQVWDSEEMVFLPLITEFLSIKVTELKSLANHVVVGNVCCETKDLFAALPQTVAVDINDLGTIKLSLEVTWNPFDKDDQSSAASTVNKTATVNKRFSTYNQSPPDTPSLREQAFYNSPQATTEQHRWSLLDVFRETLVEKLSRSCSCGDVTSSCLGVACDTKLYNMLRRQEEMENPAAWSNSSESSDDSSSPQLPVNQRHAQKTVVQPEIQAAAPIIEISFAPKEEPASAGDPDSQEEEPCEEDREKSEEVVSNGHVRYSRSLSHISEASADAVIVESICTETIAMEAVAEATVSFDAMSVDDIVMEVPSTPERVVKTPDLKEQQEATDSQSIVSSKPKDSGDVTRNSLVVVAQLPETQSTDQCSSPALTEAGVVTEGFPALPRTEQRQSQQGASEVERPAQEAPRQGQAEDTRAAPSEKAKPVDSGVEEALNTLISTLDDYRGQFPELQLLEQETRHLEEILMQRQGLCRSRASSISLTVEHALESFDFLNTHDLEDSVSGSSDEEREREEEEEGASRPDSLQQGSSVPGEVLSEEIVLLGDSDMSPDYMSTGSEHLDRALVVHLDNCSHLLLQLGTFGPLRCREMYALDKLLREARVLGLVCKVSEEKSGVVNSAEEVLPFLESRPKALAFWSQCTESLNVYTTTAERFLQSLHSVFSARLHDQHASRADTVFVKLAERVLEKRLPKRGRSGRQELITLFQYWSHLEEEGVSALDTYITELAEEVSLIQSLQSGDQDTVLKTLKRVPETQLQKEGLRALSLLLLDKRIKVSNAASALLRSLADSPRSRERALVSCLELLEDESVETRVAGCKALSCLKAKESIDQLVYLCQTDKDDVREAAKQALLSFGEEGKLAQRHAEDSQDGLPRLFAPGSMASTAF